LAEFRRIVFEEATAPLLERANEPELAAAWAAGRAMSESDAAAYALEALPNQLRV
jgi:hypothetical protein